MEELGWEPISHVLSTIAPGEREREKAGKTERGAIKVFWQHDLSGSPRSREHAQPAPQMSSEAGDGAPSTVVTCL